MHDELFGYHVLSWSGFFMRSRGFGVRSFSSGNWNRVKEVRAFRANVDGSVA